jgi:C-terminal processing protease CtpA/Prc
MNAGAPPELVLQYQQLYEAMLAANQKGELLTQPLPLCTSSPIRIPNRDRDGNFIGYSKPVMLIIDEFSTSTADSFAAMMQDNRRAVLFGMRTNGAGGNNTAFDAGAYSETYVGMTLALQVRPNWTGTLDYPTTRYIENVGVRPDVESDYMTKDNLLKSGGPFVDDMLAHAAAYIRSRK